MSDHATGENTSTVHCPPSADQLRLRRQWVIGTHEHPVPAGWNRQRLNDRHTLFWHPDTALTATPAGHQQFVILGPAVARCAAPTTTLHAALAAPDTDAAICAFLDDLVGMYVAVHVTAHAVKLYTDPAGMQNVFFRAGIAASSPTLIPDLAHNEQVMRAIPPSQLNDWYPWTLTQFADVRVLPANHVLDLDHATFKRFWPRRSIEPTRSQQGLDALGTELSEAIVSMLDTKSVLVSLTGGRDSRVNSAILAASGRAPDCFTINVSPKIRRDVETARQLATELKLSWTLVAMTNAPPWLQSLYDEMTGGLSHGTRRDIIGSLLPFAHRDHVHLNGNLGALCWGFYWHSKHPKRVNPAMFLKDFHSRSSILADGVHEWLEGLPPLSPTTIYNLFYLEQRGGRWMGPGENGSLLFYDSFTPWCSRRVFDLICALPLELQREGRILDILVRRYAPAVSYIPYASGTAWWRRTMPSRARRIGKVLYAKLR